MQATDFEFRNRWWLFATIFTLAFMAYIVDPVNSGAALVDWLARRRGITATDNAYRLVFAIAAALVALAALIRTWATSYLRAEVMTDGRVHTDRLVADGPYRYVRNPLYLGNIFMAVGAGLMASRLGFVILVAGMIVFVMRLMLREENELRRDQGEAFQGYCAAVPRLLPAIAPRTPRSGNVARWRQAFRAELMYWLITLAIAVFAVTLNLKFFWALFALALASAFLYKPEAKTAAGQ
jgi:protein-S-isoprenylcysteine O-methyltransferase Ste14